jgi:hypothetical protein
MMIRDNRIDARLFQLGDLIFVADAAINGDDERELLLDCAQDKRSRHPVSVNTIPNFDLDRVLGEERTNASIEYGSAGEPIRIEIAVDEHTLGPGDGQLNPIERFSHAIEKERRVQVIQTGIDQCIPVPTSSLCKHNGKRIGATERCPNG